MLVSDPARYDSCMSESTLETNVDMSTKSEVRFTRSSC